MWQGHRLVSHTSRPNRRAKPYQLLHRKFSTYADRLMELVRRKSSLHHSSRQQSEKAPTSCYSNSHVLRFLSLVSTPHIYVRQLCPRKVEKIGGIMLDRRCDLGNRGCQDCRIHRRHNEKAK